MNRVLMSEDTISAVTDLARALWPHSDYQKLQKEFTDILSSPKDEVFIILDEQKVIAFAHCSLRQDYVEGSHSSPTAYLEGIYVLPDYRKQGVARLLIEDCQTWGKEQGCTVLASDAELINTDSQLFHEKAGFQEVSRTVSYIKKIVQ